MANRRDPETVQVWVIGSGIASLAAAVYFIKEAKVPAKNIHILESHSGAGGGITSGGDAVTGYVLHQGPIAPMSFHDPCTENFLSLVPSMADPEKSLLQEIKDFNSQEHKEQTAREKEREQREDYYLQHSHHHHHHGYYERPASPTARVLVEGIDGPQKLDLRKMGLGLRDRFELFQVMIESEQALENKMVSDIFSANFFASNFWIIWSTTYV
jgi:oleate hydratase